jgi:cell wall-associated NlpC family hydrolase
MDDAQRTLVVKEALSWLNTPYHPLAREKGLGVDCVMLLAEVYERAGLIPHLEPGFYSVQQGLHSVEEVLESVVLAHGCPVAEPLPGDAVLFRYGRSYSHAGIMITPTRFVHAMAAVGLVCTTDLSDGEVAGRDPRFYTVGAPC